MKLCYLQVDFVLSSKQHSPYFHHHEDTEFHKFDEVSCGG